MKILHIAAHLGDGAGKAIGGMARIDHAAGNENKILLLQEPRKRNHVERCIAAGVEVLRREAAESAIEWADVVVLNWWGSPVMDAFLQSFPAIPCRTLLWAHKNGFYDPPLPQSLGAACGGLLVTSPLSLTRWPEAALVYGFGDFASEQIEPKADYALHGGEFVIGYVGSPSFKKMPPDTTDYFRAALDAVPGARFVLAGESTDAFRQAIAAAGLTDRVELLGWTPNIFELLRSFDAFGYLLRRDTFATTENAVLEAMAAGLPVVITKEPLGRYIAGEDAALFADSPQEYADALRLLYQSRELRRQKGRSGRKYVLSQYCAKTNEASFRAACELAMCREAKTVAWSSK